MHACRSRSTDGTSAAAGTTASRAWEEAERVRLLGARVDAWIKNRRVRAYVATVERRAQPNGGIEPGSEGDHSRKTLRRVLVDRVDLDAFIEARKRHARK